MAPMNPLMIACSNNSNLKLNGNTCLYNYKVQRISVHNITIQKVKTEN